MEQEEKILKKFLVDELGLNKLDVITSDMLEGYTSIIGYAFYRRNSLTSITLPNSVTSIGDNAFYNCSSLTSITIPNSVTSIGWGAFYNCYSLTSVIIGNSVTNIGYHAFAYCHSLISIILPNTVTSIKGGAFRGCSKLKSVNIPKNITNIEHNIFCGCTNLITINIPKNIKLIDFCPFVYCNKLKNVVIGDKVYKKHKVIKNKCKAYKAFNADLTCLNFKYEEGKTYEIDGEPKLCKQGFHACLNLTDVFNHYRGEIGKDIAVHEVTLEGVTKEKSHEDTKVVAKKITIGKRIL